MTRENVQRDKIVYFGIIQFDYCNAMCQHAKGIKKLIQGAGYKAILIGVSSQVKRNGYKIVDEDTYVINEPQRLFERVCECISIKDIKNVLYSIGLDRIKAFIMADYRYVPMKKMMNFCEKQGILFVANIMDRFEAKDNIVNVLKKMDSDMRIKYLYPKVDRRIYICSSFIDLIGEGKHVGVIPGVTWENRKEGAIVAREESYINLAFLGRPGLRCEKEKIDWVIRAVKELGLTNRFKIYCAGFDKEEFLQNNIHLKEFITENTRFLGRLSHDESLKLLQGSDFSLIIRPDTVLSNYGFSTKIGEAFSCGIPVLATDTSDNKLYIVNGKNGFVCGCTYSDVCKMLKEVSMLEKESLYKMREDTLLYNPLDYRNYQEVFMKVVD